MPKRNAEGEQPITESTVETPPLPELKPPYTNDLARRLVAFIRAKNSEPFTGKRSGGKRFSLKRLAEKSGVGYWSLVDYVIRQNSPMSLQVVDSLMFGLGINVLDLLEPRELAQAYSTYDRQSRYYIRQLASKSGESLSTKVLPQNSTPVPSDLP